MPALQIYVDDRTLASLHAYAKDHGRTVEDLAEAAVSEAALTVERPTQPKITTRRRKAP